MADQTRDFAQEMEEVISTPFEFFDETLSSVEVAQRLREKGIKQSVRNGPIDHFAAALILEQWLETSPSE
jgi:putative transcription antitermination factor YqgF